MRFSSFFTGVLLVVLCAGSVEAFEGEYSLGIKGGSATYLGDIDDRHFSPYDYGAISIDRWMNERFALGILAGLPRLLAIDRPYYFESHVLNISGLLKIRPFGKTSLSPYLFGGIEVIRFSPVDEGGNKLPNNLADEYDLTQASIPLGGGISFFLSEQLSFDVEGVYHYPFTDYIDDWDVGDSNDAYVVSSVGLTWYFGGKPKDTDGDGIIDDLDRDPLHPEDFDGYRDTDGAPDPDNDGDGILDIYDKAPLEPEDQDGYMDSDGVPDPDNDGDGISDVNDRCPDKAEVFNGYKDGDGCPDRKPEIEVKKGEAVVLEGVFFMTGSAELTPESQSTLDKVVRTLRDNPEIEVEIRGYTDNTGPYEYNLTLSQQRADSVKQYLVDNGIAEYRIGTKGFGPENPVASNDTREGRAKNRRIEFFRLN
jgi:outer membrane protein OmpA-like peptidoglycan-associated protein